MKSLIASVLLLLLLAACHRDLNKRVLNNPRHISAKGGTDVDYDSIWSENVLSDALRLSLKQNSAAFERNYAARSADCTYVTQVQLRQGDLFGNGKSYLIVRRKKSGTVDVDVFAAGRKPQHLIAFGGIPFTYVGNTIRDVNGDGTKDFVVDTYGSSGCCLKAFSAVYLARPDGRSFSEPVDFTNPTFFPDEQVVRGVAYGYRGIAPLYKKKWEGENLEDVEYVFFETDTALVRSGRIIRADSDDVTQAKKVEYLKEIPKEYESIFGFDWFLGKDE